MPGIQSKQKPSSEKSNDMTWVDLKKTSMHSPKDDFVVISSDPTEEDERPLRDSDSNAHEVVNFYIQMVTCLIMLDCMKIYLQGDITGAENSINRKLQRNRTAKHGLSGPRSFLNHILPDRKFRIPHSGARAKAWIWNQVIVVYSSVNVNFEYFLYIYAF